MMDEKEKGALTSQLQGWRDEFVGAANQFHEFLFLSNPDTNDPEAQQTARRRSEIVTKRLATFESFFDHALERLLDFGEKGPICELFETLTLILLNNELQSFTPRQKEIIDKKRADYYELSKLQFENKNIILKKLETILLQFQILSGPIIGQYEQIKARRDDHELEKLKRSKGGSDDDNNQN